jgi:16S rRNA (guanine527-N7)-methyltransferase
MTSVIDLSLAGQGVSRETLDRLEAFAALVRRWNPTVNLISRSSLEALWDRHIADSAQLFAFCPAGARHWADLGSGGGFPGLVIAVLAKEQRPDLRVTLVEADQRKATFLRQAAQSLEVPVAVHSARIESLPPLAADVISARALAPLDALLALAQPHLQPGGLVIFPKGARHAEEIDAARQAWIFDVETHPSVSQPDSAILIIRKYHRARPS